MLLGDVWKTPSRKRVLKRLVEDAEGGDHDARTLLLAYAYGKPKDDVEHSGALRIVVEYTDDTDAAAPSEPEADTG